MPVCPAVPNTPAAPSNLAVPINVPVVPKYLDSTKQPTDTSVPTGNDQVAPNNVPMGTDLVVPSTALVIPAAPKYPSAPNKLALLDKCLEPPPAPFKTSLGFILKTYSRSSNHWACQYWGPSRAWKGTTPLIPKQRSTLGGAHHLQPGDTAGP